MSNSCEPPANAGSAPSAGTGPGGQPSDLAWRRAEIDQATGMLTEQLGTGIADDKAVYSYMPAIVKFYLGEEPILKNVPTWRCREPKDLAYVLDNLSELVVKEVHGSGGYGMLIGPAATKATIEAFRDKLKREPEGFIAQPTLALSTCPTCTASGLAPRHVDLRPFVLTRVSADTQFKAF